MGCGLENRCAGRVYGADVGVPPHYTLIKLPCYIKLAFQVIS